MAYGQRDANPIDELPSYIRKINDWGQRADFSHDGRRILFMEKTYGDAFELDLASGNITPVTHHYYHGGYTRALYLANGDILLSGCTNFDAGNRFDESLVPVLDTPGAIELLGELRVDDAPAAAERRILVVAEKDLHRGVMVAGHDGADEYLS